MKKGMKLVCMVLTLAMLLGLLAGCGGKGGDDSNGGGSDQTLLLGLIGPMTGDYAHYGTSTRDGAQVAVEEINAARRRQRLAAQAADRGLSGRSRLRHLCLW